jgi:hypothetical protein
MFLEARLVMKQCINRIESIINKHPKLKKYLWFIGLWLFGLISVSVLTYPLKLLMKNLA